MGLRLVRDDAGDRVEAPIGMGHVHAEARRRIVALGYDRHRARALATGSDMPRDIHIKHLQIMAVAMALCSLETIPEDYRSEMYWPT
ncbi:hypothetical protein [Rhizobium sp. Leaf341]|uniref:hypothetical protein n=1 Tax=Rhizobium sp. Leaf341 TaxID=1736344 RepID=UPI0007158B4E|nr:hypothetical protein [Rhizobium sp. Leaf341]KQR77873.1 hypothetical protein ASG03_16055 [Rhizobium sp. Leaf341]